jgi:hypothetical protein
MIYVYAVVGSAVVRTAGLLAGGLVWLAVYLIMDRAWRWWYLRRPPTISTKRDVVWLDSVLRMSSWPFAFGLASVNRLSLWCTNEQWQAAVQTLLRHATAVLVDVSHPSDSLRWEIQEALASGAEVIFSCSQEQRHYAARHVGQPLDWEKVLYYPPSDG